MSIQKVNITDKIKDFAGKYNDTTDEIVISGLVNASNQLELTKNGGGIITIDLPFSNDKIITGMELTVTGAGPFTGTITAGSYQIDGVVYVYAGGAFPIAVVTSPNERIDIFYADNLGVVTYLAGTPSLTPVRPSNPAGTLLIGVVYVNSSGAGGGGTTNINAGFLNNQTLRWDSASSTWLPNSNLLASTTKVAIGTALTNAILAVDGDIEILPMTAPFPVTDKLYNLSGDLYWNGSLVGLADGTVTGSHLYWDGLTWGENTFWKVEDSAFNPTARIHTYTETDSTGVVTKAKLGDSQIERGFYFLVDDTLNGYFTQVDITSNSGDETYFQVYNSDNNLGAAGNINSSSSGNNLRALNFTDDRQCEIKQTESSNILEANLSSKDPLNRNQFIQNLTSTTSVVKNNTNISQSVQGVNDFTFTTADTTQVDTEFVIGNVPVAGENGFQFRVNDVLGSNDLYMLLTAQDSVNNKTTFKVNQLDSLTSDFSAIELSTKVNQINLLDGVTGNFYETIQTNTNGVVNRAVSTAADSFVKVTPAQINLDSYNVATPTTYTSLIQTSTGFQLYSNNSNVNLISNITTSNGLINFNGGISERYVNTAVNRAVVTNDYIIIATVAPLTITLPAAPVNGRKLIIISNGVATGGNPITINGNGKNINAAATSSITTAYGTTTLHYNNSLNKWLIII